MEKNIDSLLVEVFCLIFDFCAVFEESFEKHFIQKKIVKRKTYLGLD